MLAQKGLLSSHVIKLIVINVSVFIFIVITAPFFPGLELQYGEKIVEKGIIFGDQQIRIPEGSQFVYVFSTEDSKPLKINLTVKGETFYTNDLGKFEIPKEASFIKIGYSNETYYVIFTKQNFKRFFSDQSDVFVGRGVSGLQALASQINILIFTYPYFFFYQLFTSIFIHFGILHLTLNMIALFYFGSIIEYNYGKKNFLIIYFSSGLAGNVASLFLLKYLPFAYGNADLIPSAGASGAIFGLIGAFVILGRLTGGLFSALVYASFILLMSSTFPGVNIFAHLFGFIGGLVTSYLIIERYKKRKITAYYSEYY